MTREELVIREVPEGIIRQIELREPEPEMDRLPSGWLSSEIEDMPVVLDIHVFQDRPHIYATFLLGCGHFSRILCFRPRTVFDMDAVLRPIVLGGWPFGCHECGRDNNA